MVSSCRRYGTASQLLWQFETGKRILWVESWGISSLKIPPADHLTPINSIRIQTTRSEGQGLVQAERNNTYTNNSLAQLRNINLPLVNYELQIRWWPTIYGIQTTSSDEWPWTKRSGNLPSSVLLEAIGTRPSTRCTFGYLTRDLDILPTLRVCTTLLSHSQPRLVRNAKHHFQNWHMRLCEVLLLTRRFMKHSCRTLVQTARSTLQLILFTSVIAWLGLDCSPPLGSSIRPALPVTFKGLAPGSNINCSCMFDIASSQCINSCHLGIWNCLTHAYLHESYMTFPSSTLMSWPSLWAFFITLNPCPIWQRMVLRRQLMQNYLIDFSSSDMNIIDQISRAKGNLRICNTKITTSLGAKD